MCIRKVSGTALRQIFIYGTLKKGQPNHHWFTSPGNGFSRYVGRATTTTKMPLVIATRYNIPFLLSKPNHGQYVAGEIYDVDDKLMARIDQLEGNDVYTREEQTMNLGVNEGTSVCWVYLLKQFPDKLLTLPHLSEYKNTFDRPYMPLSERKGMTPVTDDLLFNTATGK